MIVNLSQKYSERIVSWAERFTQSSFWRIKAAISCTLIAMTLAFPSYDMLTQFVPPPKGSSSEGLHHQLRKPFKPIPKQYFNLAAGHLEKRAFRITIPIIASVLGLDLIGCLALQHIAGFLFFYVLLLNVGRFCKDNVMALFTAVGFSLVFVGVWCFNDYFCFDGFAYFFLLCAMTWRKPLLIFTFTLLAAFTDERALIASSFVYLWWVAVAHYSESRKKSVSFYNFRPLAVVIAWVAYFTLRYFLQVHFGLSTGTQGINMHTFLDNYRYLHFGVLSSIEMFWLLVAAVAVVFLRDWKFYGLLFLAAILITHLTAFFVMDVTRSVGYVFPAVIVSIFVLKQYESTKTFQKICLVVVLLCFIYPTTVITDKIYWMSPVLPKIFKTLNL
jgi:hypothetical protein